jgi:hypothetical protein
MKFIFQIKYFPLIAKQRWLAGIAESEAVSWFGKIEREDKLFMHDDICLLS